VDLAFNPYRIYAKLENVLGRRAYDSDQLQEQLCAHRAPKCSRRTGLPKSARRRTVDDCAVTRSAAPNTLGDTARSNFVIVVHRVRYASLLAVFRGLLK
jgi:hypothetical protein